MLPTRDRVRLGLFLLGSALASAVAVRGEERGLDPAKALTQYALDSWPAEMGLPQNTVNAILQTRDGYLWVATYDGLARFDGVRFTAFHKGNTPALQDNGIRALAEDSDGALWIGTNGGGIVRYSAGRFEHFSPGGDAANDIVWALHAASDGGVWVGTNTGTLYLFRNGIFKLASACPNREPIYAVHPASDGTVWFGTHGGGLKHLEPDGKLRSVTSRDGLPSDFVLSILESSNGGLWIGTLGGGLAHLAGNRIRRFGTRDGLPDDVISAILRDRRGSLWLATRRGLVRKTEARFEVLRASDGLGDETLYALHEDREGTLWIGTRGAGLCRLRDGSFTVYAQREGLPDDYAYSLHEDASGTVWVGTGSGLARLEGGRWQRVTSADGLCNDAVRSVWSGRPGELWVGTYGGGVCRLSGPTWTRYTEKDGLARDNVRSLVGTRDGSIWVGTVDGLSRFQSGTWRTFTTRDGLAANSVICLREDATGGLWIGTDGGGLNRYRNGHFETLTQRNGLPSNVILVLFEDRERVLWIGTNGGLARFKKERIASFTTRDGMPSDSVYQIVDDQNGNLWIGTSRGVVRIAKNVLEDRAAGRPADLAGLVLGRSDGMRSIQCTAPAQPGAMRSRDGRLWFATVRGVAVLDPEHLRTPDESPPLAIESVLADERIAEASSAVELRSGIRRLAVHYTALCLLAPEKVTFRYRLIGYDDDWVGAGGQRTATYTGLPPGDYRFEVTARTGSGPWNPTPAAFSLLITPRVYQTRVFYVIGAVTVVVVILGSHRLRTSRLRARQRDLARLVEERTHSLQEEKERAELARHEAEQQRRLAEQADAVKTEFLGVAAHDLKNPLHVIEGMAHLLVSRGGSRFADLAEALHQSSQRMLGLIDDLLNTAALDGKVDLRPRPLDVGILAEKVTTELRERAEAKGQALSLVIQGDCVATLDEDRLRDVMENLIDNAIKYSPRGTPIRVGVTDSGAVIRFEVLDEGPGLTAADLERVFGRFQRLSARPTAGEPSTGLGLYIVKRILELFGGRIWAESEGEGRGARFVCELPRRPGP